MLPAVLSPVPARHGHLGTEQVSSTVYQRPPGGRARLGVVLLAGRDEASADAVEILLRVAPVPDPQLVHVHRGVPFQMAEQRRQSIPHDGPEEALRPALAPVRGETRDGLRQRPPPPLHSPGEGRRPHSPACPPARFPGRPQWAGAHCSRIDEPVGAAWVQRPPDVGSW